MNFENIHKRSIRYSLLRAYGRFLHNFIFYRKVYVHGIENIPKNTPLIITANHQNALMDACAIGYAADHQPVFLARSDIFTNPFIGRLMKFVKIMPVYRIRDGVESMGKNEEIFNLSVNVLKNNKRIALMPEGNHGGKRKLRPLKKGAARIAFMAEAESDFNLGLRILPVGLDYGNYTNFRASLFVNIGVPFSIVEFKEIYKENPRKAYLLFNEKLRNELSLLMIDIQNDEYYDTYTYLRELYNPRMRERIGLPKKNLKNRFYAGKQIISMLDILAKDNPEKLKKLKELIMKFHDEIAKFNLKFWIFERKKFSYLSLFLESILQLIFLPVHIYGVITNYLPYKIPVWVTNGIKDQQFVSSVKYIFLLVIFIVFYLIEYIIFSFFADSVWIRNIFLLSLPLAGFFAIETWILFKKLKAKWIYNIALSNKDEKLLNLVKLRHEIIQKLDAEELKKND